MPAPPPPTPGKTSDGAPDWARGRGDRWRAQAGGMEAMLAPIDEPLLDALQLEGSLRIADVGCGGGATSLALLAGARARGGRGRDDGVDGGLRVHGFDISPALVELARSRIPPGEAALAFHLADMGRRTPAELGEAPYHRLASRFGVMFFDDPRAAFANLATWLVPGGRFAFAVWGPPAENPWMTLVRDVVMGITAVPPPDPEAPGPFRYADGARFATLLGNAGLADVTTGPWRGTLMPAGGLPPPDAARFALASFATFADLLAEAGPSAQAKAQAALTAAYERHVTDGVVRMKASVNVVTGVRP